MATLSPRSVLPTTDPGRAFAAATTARDASFGSPNEPLQYAINTQRNPASVEDIGPANPTLVKQPFGAFLPPSTAVGEMPTFWASFKKTLRNGILNGGRACQVTQADFGTSESISGGEAVASSRTWRSCLTLGGKPERRTIAMFARMTRVVLVRPRALLLLSGLAACTGSPATLALQPDFEVMTAAGIASVSIRQSPPGMTDAEFTQLVKTGMEDAARGSVIAGRVEPPFPSQRIVWHVNLSPSRGISRLVVNVFDGANPYAYEQETVTNSAPTAAITSAVESMSGRLLADVAAQANMRNQLGRQIPQNETNRTILSRR